ncbi:MAG: hypothetical protein VKP72_10785 [bacterium]|nr:hypothetical protein [bacterium]
MNSISGSMPPSRPAAAPKQQQEVAAGLSTPDGIQQRNIDAQKWNDKNKDNPDFRPIPMVPLAQGQSSQLQMPQIAAGLSTPDGIRQRNIDAQKWNDKNKDNPDFRPIPMVPLA